MFFTEAKGTWRGTAASPNQFHKCSFYLESALIQSQGYKTWFISSPLSILPQNSSSGLICYYFTHIFQASDNCSICVFHPICNTEIMVQVQWLIVEHKSAYIKSLSEISRFVPSTIRIRAHKLAPLNSSGFLLCNAIFQGIFKIVYHFKGGYRMYRKRTIRQLKSRWQSILISL